MCIFNDVQFALNSLSETCLWNFFWSVFSRILQSVSFSIQSECRKYRPDKTPYLETFHAVIFNKSEIKRVKKQEKKKRLYL